MKGEIINLDPETNPKLKEIFDLLLLAGYFRIRIPSIKPLDKILGGLSWCITQSNFAIDIQYSDDYNIGQKIKVSELIVKSLTQMNSPYKLQPHQIQGLDLQAIYPIVKWLIKFVIETREFRQDQNARVSKLVGKNSLQALQTQDLEEKKAIQEVVATLDLIQDQRQTKNLKKLSKKDPLRVYSTLIEYGDLSSQKTYNKFCALISGIQGQGAGNKKETVQSLLIGEQTKKQDTGNQQVSLEQLANMQKEKNQQTQQQIKEMVQGEASKDSRLNEEEGKRFQKLQRRNSISGIGQLISQEQLSEALKEKQQDEVVEQINYQLQERQLLEQQIKMTQQSLVNYDRRIQEDQAEINAQKESQSKLASDLQEESKRKKELEDALRIIDQKTKKASQAEIKRAEELVKRRQDLKDQKAQLKKEIKQEMKQLEAQHEASQQELPEEDAQLLAELKQEYQQKKSKFENKFSQFQQLVQEITVLERKIQNYPSTAEIAQYHLRFVELYDAINQEMEENKKQFMRYNNLQELKQWAVQFSEIMLTFKDNYSNNLKDKKGKQELCKNLEQTYNQLQQNLNQILEKVQAQEKKRCNQQDQYKALLVLERDYYRFLKEIKLEYERNEILQS